MKQDITPQRPMQRRPVTVPSRGIPLQPGQRPVGVVHTSVTSQTQKISDILPSGEVIITETVTTTYDTDIEQSSPIKEIESLSPQAKNEALQRALRHANRSLKKERRKQRDLKRFGLVLAAAVLVLLTGYVSIDTILTNQQVKAETSERSTVGSNSEKDEEGQDESVVSPVALSTYSVAPDAPKAIYINKINVSARVLPMSVNTDGSVQSPKNIFDAGWYTGSVKPGEIGAMFIDGHASGPTREGLLAYLDKLVEGDEIQIEKGDGSRLTYKVVHTEVTALSDIDMKKVLLPYGNNLRGLNLMTCTGNWVEDLKTYDQRVVVYAAQV